MFELGVGLQIYMTREREGKDDGHLEAELKKREGESKLGEGGRKKNKVEKERSRNTFCQQLLRSPFGLSQRKLESAN